jgi:hypothetical protein
VIDGPRSGLTSRTAEVLAAERLAAPASVRSGAETSKAAASVNVALS